MALNRRRFLGAGLGLSTAAAAAACGGGTSAAVARPAVGRSGARSPGSPAAASGPPDAGDIDVEGVANLLQTTPFEHLDPQNIYLSNAHSISRLMFRQLMGWHEDPAAGTFTLVPDLAAAPPTHNADNTVWSFRLRRGVKYADGTPVTPADVKYGVERSMDPAISFGPQYARQYLVGAADYGGPSKGGLASISLPDADTITFTLAQPVGTWAELCTLTTFTPVPRARDTGRAYDLGPVCMGPYTIGSYRQSATLVLVRNPHWDAATDPLRSQHFRQVNVSMTVDGATLDEELFADAQSGSLVAFSDPPQPADVPRALEPAYASRTYRADTSAVEYLQVSTAQPALRDARVRRAIAYTQNPSATIKAAGGAALFAPTQSMVPASLAGFAHVAPVYPDLGATGNPAKARQLLAAAGVHDLTVSAPYPSFPGAQAGEQVAVQAYARAGITLVPRPLSPDTYFSTVSNPVNHFDIYDTNWEADIPDCSTIFPTLFRGGANIRRGSLNFAGLNLPALDAQLARALTVSPAQALPMWHSINRFLVQQAYAIPTYTVRTVQMVGSKIRGAYLSPVLGTLDITNAYLSRT